ncbi:MAG: hypothetical protein P4L57_11785 [Rhizomicrobium sp.]|nr:hypothetical protein [Rhizomicrobium sp.]
MRLTNTVILAAAAVAAVTGLAFAAGSSVHEMIVNMPDGGVAHIRYTGDVAPKVNFVRASGFAAPIGYFDESPFAEMDRISALMDRQMVIMMQQALHNAPLSSAEFKALPAGSGYSFASTLSGTGVCVKTVQITASGNAAPKVVSQTSGDCGSGTIASPGQTKAAPLQTISYKPEAARHSRQGI